MCLPDIHLSTVAVYFLLEVFQCCNVEKWRECFAKDLLRSVRGRESTDFHKATNSVNVGDAECLKDWG